MGKDAPTGPALDPAESSVAGSIKAVATFKDTDASFYSGAPSLPAAEPSLVLPLSLRFGRTPGRRDTDLFHPRTFYLLPVLCGPEARIRIQSEEVGQSAPNFPAKSSLGARETR